MPRQFSVRTVFRMVPNFLLQQFFHSLGHDEFDPKWDQLGVDEVDPLIKYLEDLPVTQANLFEQELRYVFELSCETGLQHLIDTANHECCDALVTGLPSELSLHGQAMWARLHHSEVFSKAHLIYEVESRSWWRKRNDLPSADPNINVGAIGKLELAVSELLKSEGRGKSCTIETVIRGDVFYFFVYPDDYVKSFNVHDDNGRLVSQPVRPTFECVLAYDRSSGSLEMSAKLRKAKKEALEKLFASNILHWQLADHQPEAAYYLNHLRDGYELATDPDDCIQARIVKMRLREPETNLYLTVEVKRTELGETIYEAMERALDTEEIPLWQWNVIGVSISFDFLRKGDRRPGRQTIDIGLPHSCSMRNARPDRVEIFQKYLKLWEIDNVPADQTALVAVGA